MTQSAKKNNSPKQPPGMELSMSEPASLHVVKPNGAVLGQAGIGTIPLGKNNQQTMPQVRQANLDSEDDISTFFANRQVVINSSNELPLTLKIIIGMVGVVVVFFGCFNFSGGFRREISNSVERYAAVNISEFIPAFTKSARQFKRRVSLSKVPITVIGSESQHVARESTISRINQTGEPLLDAVEAGYWSQVEAGLASKCSKWNYDHDCAIKAWYLSYRGMKGLLRTFGNFDPTQAKSQNARDQAVFLYVKSSLIDGPASEPIFAKSLELVSHDIIFQRMLIDGRLKALIRDNQTPQVTYVIKTIERMGFGGNEILKWRALEASYDLAQNGLSSSFYVKQLTDNLSRGFGVLKSDPVALIYVGHTGLRVGLVKQVEVLTSSELNDPQSSFLDSSLRKEIDITHARSLMLEGELGAAAEQIKLSQHRDGSDAVSQHLLASCYLAMKNRDRMDEARALFEQALVARSTWQSEIGLLTTLVKSGHYEEANKVAKIVAGMKNSSNAFWIRLAIDDYRFAVLKASKTPTTSKYKVIADDLAVLYNAHPSFTMVAKIYVEALVNLGHTAEADKIRSKIDEVTTKTSFLSSQEFKDSPVGPLALMH